MRLWCMLMDLKVGNSNWNLQGLQAVKSIYYLRQRNFGEFDIYNILFKPPRNLALAGSHRADFRAPDTVGQEHLHYREQRRVFAAGKRALLRRRELRAQPLISPYHAAQMR